MTSDQRYVPDSNVSGISPRARAAHGANTPSRRLLWAGRILSGLAVLFLLFDAGLKLANTRQALEATGELGYPTNVVFGIGVVQLVCLIAYLVPRTAVLGAVLWTGYLGGAVATHVRVGSPLVSHTLFPVYIAVLLWAGLWLRDWRARAVLAAR